MNAVHGPNNATKMFFDGTQLPSCPQSVAIPVCFFEKIFHHSQELLLNRTSISFKHTVWVRDYGPGGFFKIFSTDQNVSKCAFQAKTTHKEIIFSVSLKHIRTFFPYTVFAVHLCAFFSSTHLVRWVFSSRLVVLLISFVFPVILSCFSKFLNYF